MSHLGFSWQYSNHQIPLALVRWQPRRENNAEDRQPPTLVYCQKCLFSCISRRGRLSVLGREPAAGDVPAPVAISQCHDLADRRAISFGQLKSRPCRGRRTSNHFSLVRSHLACVKTRVSGRCPNGDKRHELVWSEIRAVGDAAPDGGSAPEVGYLFPGIGTCPAGHIECNGKESRLLQAFLRNL